MDSYIIRIYRNEEGKPEAIVGTAERIGVEEKKAFRSVAELLQILSTAQPKMAGGKKNRAEEGEAHTSKKRRSL